MLHNEIDFEAPTPFLDQVYLGCTQREATCDLPAVRSKTELSKKVNDQGGSRSYQTNEKNSLGKNIVWSLGMEGHAEKCVERYCDIAKKDVSILQVQKRPPNISGI